jgi:hypothetical protein
MSLIAGGNNPGPSSVPTQMPTDEAMSRGRRFVGPAALVATAGGLAAVAVREPQWIEWSLLAFAGLVGAAGVGLARRSMPLQVLSRATAWTVLVPSALITSISLFSGHTEWTAAALVAGSGGALLLARPMLHSAEARADFAPSSFRRWLLAGATASATAGIMTGVFALDGLHWHTATAVALLGLSLSLLASAIGVVRMRAWGILLGALTSVVTLIAAAVRHDAAGLALALASVPGFMLLLPVLIAKRQRASRSASAFTRVSSHIGSEESPRIRVATGGASTFDDEFDDNDDAVAAAPRPAARAQA